MYLYLGTSLSLALINAVQVYSTLLCTEPVSDTLAKLTNYETVIAWQFGILTWSEIFTLALRYALNLCLAFDLVSMIRTPFKEKSAEMKKYFTTSVLGSALFASVWDYGLAQHYKRVIAFFSALFIVIALWSFLLARRMLNRPGFSQPVRDLVRRRHVRSFVIYIMCYLYVGYYVFYVESAYYSSSQLVEWLTAVLYTLYLFSGILTPLVRFNEPAFRSVISGIIFGGKTDSEKEMTPLFLGLASSLNVELVYIILKGITSFSNIEKAEKSGKLKRSNGDVTVYLDHIKIKNMHRWSSMTSEDEIASIIKDPGFQGLDMTQKIQVGLMQRV